ncbi:T9SS type A sorting domain-containing protein [Taibaiella lutea]|uniref:T9SS type A sorting domain-containing protein n=1 Tax=Taibaiella lutea TaxID=2608001 RepID=A0A5M6CPI6_9BACT|nr:T9SS type A sorting domain-containing protein [Taibaiella lutea]KAA5537064.1 T9SS type A sorting domain-containing protein [Taibaiella lutea]
MKVLYSTISVLFHHLKKSGSVRKSIVSGLALCVGLLITTTDKALAQVSLTASGGTVSGTYTTLNGAFAAINAGTHTGVIAITVTANTTEPATPVPLLASGTAGSSFSAVTIKPSGNVTINSDAAPAASRGIIELAGADNVTIDGDDPLTAGTQNLSIVAASVTTSGVACIRLSSNSSSGTDGADNNTIKNCIITGSRSSATSTTTNYGIQFSNGVSTSSSSTGAYSSINTIIQNNLITRCYYGIHAIGNSTSYYNTGIQILNNIIGSSTAANNVGLYGINLSYTSAASTGAAVVDGNDIQGGDYGTGFSANPSGIYLNTSANAVIIRNNNIHDIANSSTSGYGAYGIGIVASVTGVFIYNNFIRDITAQNYSTSLTTSYQNYGIYISTGSTGTKIVNNTIVLNKANKTTYGTSNPVSACINLTSSSAVLSQLLNNVLINNQGAASTAAYGVITSASGNISAAAVNNNNYPNASLSKVGYYGAARATVSDWQQATGKDGLAQSENPLFTSATDLHIPNGTVSFLESGGAPVAVTGVSVDYDNQTRPGPSTFGFGTAPDIGADEFDGNVAYTCTTPNPGATLASNIPLCSGYNTTLSLSNATAGTGVTYQWQASSTLGGTYVDSVGATGATYTITPGQSAYYRCKVTCANGPASAISTPVQVTFTNNVLSVTPATRCGAGTLSLSATGNAGTTLKWYASANNTTPLGTGTNFTTPVISNSTNFYVAAESPNSGILGAGATVGSNYDAIFYHLYGGCQSQFLIKASELQAMGIAAGNINSLGININAATGSYAGFQVSIGTTTNTDMSAGLFTGTLNPVYSAANYIPSTGINTFPFSSAFVWDGTSNLIVKFCWSNNNGGGNSSYARLDNVGFVACAYFRQDSQTPATICGAATGTGTTSNRPQFYINVCNSARVAVAATVTPAPAFVISPSTTVCNNGVTALTVTSNTADFNNVTWTPSTNLYANAAGTVPYTGANANTVYFKSGTSGTAVYFANALNTTSLCGNIDTVTVQTLPATASVLAATGTSCQTGSSVLNITPSITQTGVKYQWQSSSDNVSNNFNDIIGAAGATYTTPAITNTTYYRVAVKDSNNVTCFNSISDTVKINNPLITGPVSGERCGPGTVNLVAANNGDGSITTWYDAATGGNVVSTGTNFTTPSLSATTSYWAEASIGGTAVVGPVSPAAQGGTIGTQTVAWDVNFTVLQSTTLTSVDIYPVTSGETGVIKVVNGTGTGGTVINTINYTTNVGGGTTPQTIQINTALAPGTYSLYTSTLPSSGLKRNTSGAVYPYTSPVANITGNGYDQTYFMGMYNWTFGSKCTSPRVQITATVNAAPTAGISPTGTVQLCAGNTTTLTGTGGGTYQWRNAAGNLSGANTNTYTTGVSGNYRVYVTTPAGCTDTSATVSVVVNPLPVVNLGNDTTFCSGNSLILNAGTSGNAYLWDNATTTQTRVVNTSGNYYVRVTNSFNCIKRDTIAVTVNPTPVVNIGNDAFVCTGVSYTMNAGNAGATYHWDDNSIAQTRTVNTSGTYFVKVTNSFNCSKSDTAVITYLASPVVNLGPDKEGCAGDAVTLNAGNPGNTFLWDNGSTQQTRNVLVSGTYNVQVTNAANCHGYDTISVIVHALPFVNLGNDTVICHGKELVLNAGNPGSSYLWNDNSTLQTLVVNTSGDYNVHVTDNNNCVGTDAINVFVRPLPSGLINAVHGDTATYTFNVLNPQYIISYIWNFGDGSALVSGNMVQHRYAQNGQYVVSVKLMGECEDSTLSSRTVEVYDAPGGSTGIQQIGKTKDLTLYPNPAKDLVIIENLGNLNLEHITVYNIVGQTVYNANAENKMKHKIDVSGFVPGMYTVRIETSAGIVVRKFEILK